MPIRTLSRPNRLPANSRRHVEHVWRVKLIRLGMEGIETISTYERPTLAFALADVPAHRDFVIDLVRYTHLERRDSTGAWRLHETVTLTAPLLPDGTLPLTYNGAPSRIPVCYRAEADLWR
jgi:hypothetical protein